MVQILQRSHFQPNKIFTPKLTFVSPGLKKLKNTHFQQNKNHYFEAFQAQTFKTLNFLDLVFKFFNPSWKNPPIELHQSFEAFWEEFRVSTF